MSDFMSAILSSGSGVALTEFSMSSIPSTSTATTCNYTLDTTRWHDGEAVAPINGDTIYTDSGGTTTLSGLNRWWKITPFSICIVSNGGVVSSLTECGPPI